MLSINSSRLELLEGALRAYKKIGIDFIGMSEDGTPFSVVLNDDVGIFYFIPKIALLFDLSVYKSAEFFFGCLLALSSIVAALSFLFLYKNYSSKFISIFFLFFLSIETIKFVSVGSVHAVCVLGVIPLSLCCFTRKKLKLSFISLLFVFVGVLVGYCHFLRAYCHVAPVLFFLTILFFSKLYETHKKIILVLSLLLGILIPYCHIKLNLNESKNYLTSCGVECNGLEGHIFWHSLFAGMGYLSNSSGFKWDDRTVTDKVNQMFPNSFFGTNPSEYDKTVKKCFFKTFLNRNLCWFVVETIFAKLGVLFYFFLWYANFGLIFAFFYRKPLFIDFAFFIALAFSSLFCFVSIPVVEYAGGFIYISKLYRIISICFAIENGLLRDIKNYITRKYKTVLNQYPS